MTDIYMDPAPDAGPIVIAVPRPDVSPEVIAMRPDVTKAQVIALIQAVLALLAAFGLHITQEQRDAILDLSGQLGIALILADAGLRAARNLSDRGPIKP